jgi:molybdate transport system substrate-binding protein
MLTAAFRLLCLALLFPALLACGEMSRKPETGAVVLAASSLQESLEEVGKAWVAEGHAAPVLSFAASSALARQIEQGAPADLFVSADEEWMDTVEAQGLLRPGTRGDVLTNRLVLISSEIPVAPQPPIDTVDGFRRELAKGRIAIADPNAVPAGKYARASLQNLVLWDEVSDRIVPAENVRAALMLVARTEARLGIVYYSDAMAGEGLPIRGTLPEGSHPPIRYPAAVLAGSTHPDATAFRAFLGSDEARRIFAEHGFGIAE